MLLYREAFVRAPRRCCDDCFLMVYFFFLMHISSCFSCALLWRLCFVMALVSAFIFFYFLLLLLDF